MNHIIKSIDPDSIKKYPEGRTFTVCPLTPLVRKRLFGFFKQLLNEMPVDVVATFKETKYDVRNIIKLITSLVEYIEEQDKLEQFVAIVIRDSNKSDKDKDIDDIIEFLELNCSSTKEVEIFGDFFEIISVLEMLDILQSTKSKLMASLNMSKLENN